MVLLEWMTGNFKAVDQSWDLGASKCDELYWGLHVPLSFFFSQKYPAGVCVCI